MQQCIVAGSGACVAMHSAQLRSGRVCVKCVVARSLGNIGQPCAHDIDGARFTLFVSSWGCTVLTQAWRVPEASAPLNS